MTVKEAEVLDSILESLIGKTFSSAEYDFPLLEPNYRRGQNSNSLAYLPYLKILELFDDIVKVEYNGGVNPCVKSTLKTKEFYDKGGFAGQYNRQQEENKKQKKTEELQLSNISFDNIEKRFGVKTQKLRYILTIVGVVLSLIGIGIAIISLIKSK